jgi:hypothetical protein
MMIAKKCDTKLDQVNRKTFRDHPIVVELKKTNVDDASKINLIYSVTDEMLLAYIAIYIKDGVLRRTAFLRIGTESLIKEVLAKIKEIEGDDQPGFFV